MRDESRRSLVNAMRDPGTRNVAGFFVEEETGAIGDLDEQFIDGKIDSTAYVAGLRKACAPAKPEATTRAAHEPGAELA